MLEQWDKYFPNSEKLRKRVYKGIPNSLRGEVWTRLMEVPQVKKEQEGRFISTNHLYSDPMFYLLKLNEIFVHTKQPLVNLKRYYLNAEF